MSVINNDFNLSLWLFQFFLAPPERCELPRWFSNSYQVIYDSLVKLVPKFPSNLHLLPVYRTDFTMFDKG